MRGEITLIPKAAGATTDYLRGRCALGEWHRQCRRIRRDTMDQAERAYILEWAQRNREWIAAQNLNRNDTSTAAPGGATR